MKWSFDFGWFIAGFVILVVGALIVKFHQKVANALANGVSSYDKVKLFGILACVLGLIFIANIHTTILYLIFHIIMPNQFP